MASAEVETAAVSSPGARVRPAALGLGVAAVIAAAWVAFYAAWILATPGGDGALRLFTNSAYFVPILAAVLACGVAARRSVGARRRFWLLASAGTASWLIGELFWAVEDLRHGDVPFPWWPDLFYELFYVTFAVALLRVFRPQVRAVAATDVIDAALCVGTLAVLWWRLVLEPIEVDASLASFVSLLGPILALVVLGLLVTLRIVPSRRATTGITIAAVGLVVGTLTDALDTRLTFTSSYVNGAWVEVGWQAEACLYALGAVAAILGVGERVDWSRFRDPPATSVLFAAATVAVGGAGVAVASSHGIAPRVAAGMLLGLGLGRAAGMVHAQRRRLEGGWTDAAAERLADQVAWHLWSTRSTGLHAALVVVETDAWRDGRSGTHASIERRLARLSRRIESLVPTGFGRFALLCTIEAPGDLDPICLAVETAVTAAGREVRVAGVVAGQQDGPHRVIELARERLAAPLPPGSTRTAAPGARSAATRGAPAGSPR